MMLHPGMLHLDDAPPWDAPPWDAPPCCSTLGCSTSMVLHLKDVPPGEGMNPPPRCSRQGTNLCIQEQNLGMMRRGGSSSHPCPHVPQVPPSPDPLASPWPRRGRSLEGGVTATANIVNADCRPPTAPRPGWHSWGCAETQLPRINGVSFNPGSCARAS